MGVIVVDNIYMKIGMDISEFVYSDHTVSLRINSLKNIVVSHSVVEDAPYGIAAFVLRHHSVLVTSQRDM